MAVMLECGAGRSWVGLCWEWVGSDLSVTLVGGESPHIGAVSLAFPCNDHVEVQTISVPGHKESNLTANYAKQIAKVLGCSVKISGGIHIDHASRYEIALLCKNAESLIQKFLTILTA